MATGREVSSRSLHRESISSMSSITPSLRDFECSLLAESDVSYNYWLGIPMNENYSSEVRQLPVEDNV